MKRSQNIAVLALLAALIIILAIGFYRSATHTEARPTDTSRTLQKGTRGQS